MPSYVTSRDRTRIAFEVRGKGPAVILVSGMLCDRHTLEELATELASGFRAITYDRRGRGDSGDASAYSVAREVDDIRALIAEAGGSAAVYGHSSGAGLALNAAANGLPIERLILHEPPYSAGDDASKEAARHLAEDVIASLEQGRNTEAVAKFLTAAGVPDATVHELSRDPRRGGLAHTMRYDFEVMGERAGGAIPEGLVRSISAPTLVLAGDGSLDFFRDIAVRIANALPNGTFVSLQGQAHDASADVVAAAISQFLRDRA
jgi:pimeloyl-ACP methyl ester carboxylesterase